jgi:DNA topoisomerase-1
MSVTRVLPLMKDLPADATPDEQAAATGLVYVSDDEPGYTRVRRGRGFSYHEPDGTLVEDEEVKARLKGLAIPPAWTDVWICRDADGHLQATGRDDAGRKQYRYHDTWRQLREAAKFHRLRDVADALPGIRDTVDAHLRKRSLSRERVLALLVALLDETLVRIGNVQYARTNGSYGLTTLEPDHLEIDGATIHLAFPGKSGQDQAVELRHPRLARHLLRIEDVPGQSVFAYRDEDAGDWVEVTSSMVNDYLREVADGASVTAKDFRTWGGTVVAAETLHDLGPAADLRTADANVLAAVDAAAERLGNTRAVCRASYVHPLVPKAYRFGRFDEHFDGGGDEDGRLSEAERAVRRILDLELPPSDDLEATLQASLERTDG